MHMYGKANERTHLQRMSLVNDKVIEVKLPKERTGVHLNNDSRSATWTRAQSSYFCIHATILTDRLYYYPN